MFILVYHVVADIPATGLLTFQAAFGQVWHLAQNNVHLGMLFARLQVLVFLILAHYGYMFSGYISLSIIVSGFISSDVYVLRLHLYVCVYISQTMSLL